MSAEEGSTGPNRKRRSSGVNTSDSLARRVPHYCIQVTKAPRNDVLSASFPSAHRDSLAYRLDYILAYPTPYLCHIPHSMSPLSGSESPVEDEDRYVGPQVPDIKLNINNRDSLTKPSGFYDALEQMSIANILIRLERAGCDIWSIAFNGNTLDVTVIAYDDDWFANFNKSRGDKPHEEQTS